MAPRARIAPSTDCSVIFARWVTYMYPTCSWLLRPARVFPRNDKLTGSAVFAGLTVVFSPTSRHTARSRYMWHLLQQPTSMHSVQVMRSKNITPVIAIYSPGIRSFKFLSCIFSTDSWSFTFRSCIFGKLIQSPPLCDSRLHQHKNAKL